MKLGFLFYNSYWHAIPEKAQCGYETSGTIPDLYKKSNYK